MEKLTIKGKTYTDCRSIETVTGSVKAPNGTVGEVTLTIYEMLNVSGEVNEWAIKVVGFGKEQVRDGIRSLEDARSFVAGQSKFFI